MCVPPYVITGVLSLFFCSFADGPDEPILKATPEKIFYVVGDSVSLLCQSDGNPQPTVEWVFNGQKLSGALNRVLDLTNLQTSQGGVYTCSLLNQMTNEKREKNVTLDVYGMGLVVCFY